MKNDTPSLPVNKNISTNYYPPFRSSDQLRRKLSPTDRKISPSFSRSSRSPSRAEVDEAIRTLRTPSPGPAVLGALSLCSLVPTLLPVILLRLKVFLPPTSEEGPAARLNLLFEFHARTLASTVSTDS